MTRWRAGASHAPVRYEDLVRGTALHACDVFWRCSSHDDVTLRDVADRVIEERRLPDHDGESR